MFIPDPISHAMRKELDMIDFIPAADALTWGDLVCHGPSAIKKIPLTTNAFHNEDGISTYSFVGKGKTVQLSSRSPHQDSTQRVRRHGYVLGRAVDCGE